MNLSTVALLLIAWQVLSNSGNNGVSQQNTPKNSPLSGISDFLSDDTKNIISCVNKLSDRQCSQEDRTGAIFQMITNPALMNIASSIFGGNGNQQQQPQTSQQADKDENSEGYTNSEGYKFEQPSTPAQDFFRPIDNIADAEVKHKLYWFYDNWYIK
ncbi:MAG: hypothetical protein J1F66_00695 [Clostridiales bacterium]|nr:hypothetical protein [Clostridiales bacterium]